MLLRLLLLLLLRLLRLLLLMLMLRNVLRQPLSRSGPHRRSEWSVNVRTSRILDGSK